MAGFSEAGDVNLEGLFDPGSIAETRPSATTGKRGYEAMENVADFEWPVDPAGVCEDG